MSNNDDGKPQIPESCPTPGPVLVGEHLASKVAVFFRPACGRWACPVCGETNRFRWSLRAAHGVSDIIRRGDAVYFVTLTFPGWMDADGTRARWRASWPKLSTRFRRAWADARYLYVHEQHQDGRMHVHMVTDAALSKRWWKDNCATCGFGYIADADEVRDENRVARYVAKHLADEAGHVAGRKMRKELTKQTTLHKWPDGWRRVSTSRNWPKLPEMPEPEGWIFRVLGQAEALADTYAMYSVRGWTINRLDHREAWEYVNDITAWWEDEILPRLDEEP